MLAKLTKVMALLLLLVLSVPIYLSTCQPSTGDWIVTGTEVVENRTIFLDGNLTIKSGGSLILRNVTLTLNVQYNGQHGISIEEGGSMFIYNCNISSATKNGFSFVANGSSFVMRGSELQGVGWELPTRDTAQSCLGNLDGLSHFGLLVATDQAVIEDNVFSGNDIGLILSGSHGAVARNFFSYNTLFTIVVYYSHNNTVTNNTLLQNPPAFSTCMVQLCSAENNTFLGNTLIENISYFLQHRFPLTGRMDGFMLDNSHGNAFVNNSITVHDIPVFLVHSDDCVIIDNKMNYGEMAVNILTGVNSRIERNEMNALSAGPGDFAPGAAIIATLAHNSIMANNVIAGRADRGIQLSHTSNSFILNNDIHLTRAGGPGTMTFGGTLSIMVLVGSENNSVIGNTISGSEFGMILTGSDGNLISRNNILTDHSISVLGSSSNRIFLNNLHDFKEPLGGPYDDGMNFWYSGEDGNYWSHFTGRNAEGNGVGDEPYARSAIPPSGTEPYSLASPAEITPSHIPQMKPIPRPKLGAHYIPLNVISNQVMEIGWGDFPDNLTIVNSTLFLGAEGLVRMGCYVSITNSKLIDMGYGFCPWGMGRPSAPSLIIINSTLEGAFLDDMQVDNITIVNSAILNSMGCWGISVDRSSSVIIVNSTISGALGGICTSSRVSSPPLISGNRICNVVDYGISSGSQIANATIVNNVIEGCEMGIGIIVGGGNAVVRGNTISNVDFGLELSGPKNVVCENNVVNTRHPILDCGGALIYHNNFLNYSDFPYDQSEFNELSYNGEGNYWSNYSGEDVDLDGIGDSPLMISGGGARDSYPFITPNGWLTRFWLSGSTNFPSIPFLVNETGFSTDLSGSCMLRLGYMAHYVVALPRILEVSKGTRLLLLSFNGGNSSELVLDLSSNTTVSAKYKIQYYLAVRSQPGNPQGEGWYDAGSTATFSVASPLGYFTQQAFTGWSGDSTATTTTATIVMNGPKTVSANWRTDYTQAYLTIVAAAILVVIALTLARRRKS